MLRVRTATCVWTLSLACLGCGGKAQIPFSESAVQGPVDSHCGTKVQPIDLSVCTSSPQMGMGSDDAGMAMGSSDFGATMYNAEGDDDDCKYHVSYSSTPLAEDEDVYFTVTVTLKTDGAPLTGAPIRAEVFLSDIHPGPATSQSSTEQVPGTYRVGPVRFDAPGTWTARFHFFEACPDSPETSPHAHGAFYLKVP